ncbi:MAG: PAS domain S-box protein [Nitrosomonadales bacterium]|nr:PAS domain S-box protein [Nitrosomonadales bacterium]
MKNSSTFLNTPAKVVFAVGLIILVSESLIMLMIGIVPASILQDSEWQFIDPILLTAIVSPILYFLIYRPLNRQALFEQQLEELRRFQKVVIGRELRMKELKEENSMLRMMEATGKASETSGSSLASQSGSDAAEQTERTGETEQRNALLFMLEDLEKTRDKIEQAHQQWMVALDVVSDPIFLHDKEFRILRANRAYAARVGMPFSEFIGKPYYEIFPKLAGPLSTCRLALNTGREETEELTLESGAIIRSRAAPVYDTQNKYLHSIHILEDITERKANEAKIRRLTQFYAALSQCNEAIVHCTGEDELFPQICRDSVQFGGMKMAWIGLLDKTTSMVNPAASSGEGVEYLEGIRISVDADDPAGRGPIGTAIRANRPQWCQDFQNDPLTAPWHERGAGFGWGSLAALPLLRNGTVIGIFALYSGATDAFDEAAQKLLSEMVADINFALDNFSHEAERKRSVQELTESEQRFRSVVEQSLAGIYIIQDGYLVYVNPRFAEMFGYDSPNELIGVEPTSLVSEQDRGIVAENIRSRLEEEAQSFSHGFITAVRKDGSLFDVGVHGARATHAGRPAIIGMMQDVSEKKRAEEQIQRYVTQLENSFMHTIEVATTLVEMRDPYTAGHEKRVALIAVAIGTELGLEAQRIEGLRIGGYIHDIGKIIIPAEILSKPGRLSVAEYDLIKGHPQAGYDILKNVDFPWPVADIAHQHHERMDGSGYPRGLKGDEILLEARITAVADVVEAMSSHRPYRPGIGLDQALAEIELGSGTHYDPVVAAACLRLFREKAYKLPV